MEIIKVVHLENEWITLIKGEAEVSKNAMKS